MKRHPLLQVTINGNPVDARPARFALTTDRGFPNAVARLLYPSASAAAAPDDTVTVSLSEGDGEQLYFTGAVFYAAPRGEYLDMELVDGYAKLRKTPVNPAYRKERASVILGDTLDAAGITGGKITCPDVTLHRFSTVSIPASECLALLIDALKSYGHTGIRYFFDRENTFRFGTSGDTAKEEGERYVLETGKNILRSGPGWVEILPLPIRHSREITVDGKTLVTYRTSLTVSRERSRLKIWTEAA
jgi:hypothetical protein